jgi:preprotein translocase subunit YajC
MPLAFQQNGSPGGGWLSLVPFVLVFAIFYFLLIAPMRKRQKALQQMVENLQRGDKVVTTGGLHGEVAALDGGIVVVKVADNVKVRVSKNAIAEVVDKDKGNKS